MVNIIQRWLLEHKASAIWSILYRDGCWLLQYGQYYTEMVASFEHKASMVNIIQRWLREHKACLVNIIQRWLLEHKASAIWSILYRDGCLNIRLHKQYGQYYTEMVA